MSIFMPTSLPQLRDIQARNPDARLMAGGTDVLVQERGTHRSKLICLERIPDLTGIRCTGDQIRIGAATPLSRILAHPEVALRLPVLHRAISVLGSPLIRNMATLGGNICTASPAGDSLPALHVLEAVLELAGPDGTRQVRIADFITGPGTTRLSKSEIVQAVTVPLPPQHSWQYYEKLGQRNALAIAIASFAAVLTWDGPRVCRARMAWGSAGPVTVICPEAEQMLQENTPSGDVLEAIAARIRETVRPISDVRASEAYRRRVCGNLVWRLAGAAAPS